ncbi:LytR/AlgR family response regulator transcription factor [Pseudochryseolinea flava]|uniref:DNA-binding response regulator n=1 Tax=Pseudochryseolinea flava TaxID=2059302 RepID=A0A364XZM1_9BACT|nr:LytTR family DNA-binding domain-containing protein [Pseudochryseolinea flava]RAV99981.1 DNA-binding response regulator [Pseudochryseolinea flava]
MIKTILIDDERDGLEDLQDLIKKYCTDINVISVFSNPLEALAAIRRLNPDLVFLDVQMPGMSGFELLEQLSPVSFDVIFVSAFDRYAIKAIRFSALDYLLKPVDVDELMRAVTRVKERKSGAKFSIQSALHNASSRTGIVEQLAVPSTEGIDFFNTRDIIYCKADGCYTTLYLTGKQSKVVTRVLKDFEDFLSESGFFRVHNSFLINVSHVKKYVRGEGGHVVLTDDHEVDISRRRKEEFLSILNKI